jgi:hypothetical protein
MEDLKTIRVIYNPFLGVMSMYKSGRPEPAGGWSFAHDPVAFLDLFLGIPDNVADCSSIPPEMGQNQDLLTTILVVRFPKRVKGPR